MQTLGPRGTGFCNFPQKDQRPENNTESTLPGNCCLSTSTRTVRIYSYSTGTSTVQPYRHEYSTPIVVGRRRASARASSHRPRREDHCGGQQGEECIRCDVRKHQIPIQGGSSCYQGVMDPVPASARLCGAQSSAAAKLIRHDELRLHPLLQRSQPSTDACTESS